MLLLFFIDRVANCRDYDEDDKPRPGKFAVEFEAALRELAQKPRFADLAWLREPPAALYNGYFSQDKKGVLKDTKGETQAGDDTCNLIMKDKDRLLSLDEPLQFTLDKDFVTLWEQIKPRTTCRVEFDTGLLVANWRQRDPFSPPSGQRGQRVSGAGSAGLSARKDQADALHVGAHFERFAEAGRIL